MFFGSFRGPFGAKTPQIGSKTRVWTRFLRPVDWIQHHSSGLSAVMPEENLAKFPEAHDASRSSRFGLENVDFRGVFAAF